MHYYITTQILTSTTHICHHTIHIKLFPRLPTYMRTIIICLHTIFMTWLFSWYTKSHILRTFCLYRTHIVMMPSWSTHTYIFSHRLSSWSIDEKPEFSLNTMKFKWARKFKVVVWKGKVRKVMSSLPPLSLGTNGLRTAEVRTSDIDLRINPNSNPGLVGCNMTHLPLRLLQSITGCVCMILTTRISAF